MKVKYSVLMSLYYKEKPEYLIECLNSLMKQTIMADEWVIVKDGPLTDELENVLYQYEKNYPGLIKYVVLEKNNGLGLALREGILNCSNELIARMDTDDICIPERMELQLKEFEKNKHLDICGSHIKEFEDNCSNILAIRRVPLSHNEICRYQKRRSAFNHMTVMYKKSSVLKSGNYMHAPLMEDDLLWINMLKNNCITKNIDEFLVYARTGIDMITRRGGLDYFCKYRKGRKKILETGYISRYDYLLTVIIQFFVCVTPKQLRIKVFKHLLR